MCTTRRRIPATASTNQGLEKGDLVLLMELHRRRVTHLHACITSSFLIPLICTTCRRIPATASTNQGPKKGDWVVLLELHDRLGTHLHSFTEMCSGSEAGSYLRRIHSCITQLKAEGPSRTCNESKEEEEEDTCTLYESMLRRYKSERDRARENVTNMVLKTVKFCTENEWAPTFHLAEPRFCLVSRSRNLECKHTSSSLLLSSLELSDTTIYEP